jgi:hypothetical protein
MMAATSREPQPRRHHLHCQADVQVDGGGPRHQLRGPRLQRQQASPQEERPHEAIVKEQQVAGQERRSDLEGPRRQRLRQRRLEQEPRFKVALTIGSAYQGGKVAYIDKVGDPGYVAGQTHGLIAATADQKSSGVQWYKGSYTATGATGTALGTGLSNTDLIISVQGAPSSSYAASVARAYHSGGYTDWYLPSKDELNQLYLHQKAIGNFGPHHYWSSSESHASTAWAKAFDISSPAYAYDKNGASDVRAVRSF